MEEMIGKIPAWIQGISLAFSGIVMVATAAARLTPTKKDDKFVLGAKTTLDKVLAWLPTIGVNPHTKKVEEKLQEIEESKA